MDARLRDSKVALPATGTPPEFPLGEWKGLGSPSGCLLDEPAQPRPWFPIYPLTRQQSSTRNRLDIPGPDA